MQLKKIFIIWGGTAKRKTLYFGLKRYLYKDLWFISHSQLSCLARKIADTFLNLKTSSSHLSFIWPFLSIFAYHLMLSNFCFCHSVLNLFFASSPTWTHSSELLTLLNYILSYWSVWGKMNVTFQTKWCRRKYLLKNLE